MTWDKFKKSIKKIWSWLKQYWWIPFGVLIGLFILVVLRDTEKIAWLWKAFDKATAAHKDEIEAIEAGRDLERQTTDIAVDTYEQTVKLIEKDYAEKGKELEDKKKEEIKAYVAIYKNDPEDLAKIIEEKFGVKYRPR